MTFRMGILFLPAQLQKVLKVLYKPNPQDTEQQMWLRTPAVEQITFPREVCLQMLLILAANTCTLPPSTRSVDGLQVSLVSAGLVPT